MHFDRTDYEAAEMEPASLFFPGACLDRASGTCGVELVDERTASRYSIADCAWPTNPATGQSWTAAEVNALHAGIELEDATRLVRVTQLSVTVDLASNRL